MKALTVKTIGNTMIIGDAPQLIVNLDNQENYIVINGTRIPYNREVSLSKDLLSGKRKNVYITAVRHYYYQACETAKGIEVAKGYRNKANRSTREIQ